MPDSVHKPPGLLKRLATMPNLRVGRKAKSTSQAATSADVRPEVPALVPRMVSAELGGSDVELRMAAEHEIEKLKKRIAELEQQRKEQHPVGCARPELTSRARPSDLSHLTADHATELGAAAPAGDGEEKPPLRDPTAEWLESRGAFAELSRVISGLCGGKSPFENPGPLQKVEKVQAALRGCEPKLAGLISDAASRAARLMSIAAVADWTPDERMEDPETSVLFEAALAKQRTFDTSQPTEAELDDEWAAALPSLPSEDLSTEERAAGKGREDLYREASLAQRKGMLSNVRKYLATEAAERPSTMSCSPDAFPGADHVYSKDGLPPWMWGLSKRQFETFIDDVRAAHAAGKIVGQPDPKKPRYYPQEKFDDMAVGPNMHHVNTWMIKPMTRDLRPLPGVS